jgi:UDP-N-acetylglucosamine 2-epimerase
VEDYARLIHNSACLVGNSSSALREGAFLGVPAVNIGTHQANREHGSSMIRVNYDAKEIEKAIKKQIKNGRCERLTLYGNGCAGERITKILAEADIRIQKSLYYAKSG